MVKDSFPQLILNDETLRDGLQIEREGITVDDKLQLLDMLLDAGVSSLVVGAFVNPKWSPQMADTAELVRRIRPRPGVRYTALALNERGRELCREFTPPLAAPERPGTHLFMCSIFMMRNTNTTADEQESRWRLPIEAARRQGATEAGIALSAGWGSNWQGPFSHEARMRLLQLQHDAWSAAGIAVSSVTLADPMGWCSPGAVQQDLAAIVERFPSVRHFTLHLHNARGLAMASAWEALRMLDARHVLRLDASVGGIGGCPYCGNGQATGMLPLEDLVQMLHTAGVATGIDLRKLVEVSHHLEALLGRRLGSQVARNGPLPEAGETYAQDLPVLYTFEEAQHFRLGPGAVDASRPRPWLAKLQGHPARPPINNGTA